MSASQIRIDYYNSMDEQLKDHPLAPHDDDVTTELTITVLSPYAADLSADLKEIHDRSKQKKIPDKKKKKNQWI